MTMAKAKVPTMPPDSCSSCLDCASIVDVVALGHDPRRHVLERLQRRAGGDAGERDAGDRDGIDLLEMVQRFRHGIGREARDRRQRDRGSVRGPDVIVEKLIRDSADNAAPPAG